MIKKLGAPTDMLSRLAEHPVQLQLENEAASVEDGDLMPPVTPLRPPHPAGPTLAAPRALPPGSSPYSTSPPGPTVPSSGSSAPPSLTSMRQTEIRLPTGKRRITPQFLGFAPLLS